MFNQGAPSPAPLFLSPAALLPAVLLFEPRLQRREIFEHRLARDLARAGERLERFGPRPRCTHAQHLVEPGPDFLVAVEAAAVKRSLPAGHTAGRLVELELQDSGEQVAGVRGV